MGWGQQRCADCRKRQVWHKCILLRGAGDDLRHGCLPFVRSRAGTLGRAPGRTPSMAPCQAPCHRLHALLCRERLRLLQGGNLWYGSGALCWALRCSCSNRSFIRKRCTDGGWAWGHWPACIGYGARVHAQSTMDGADGPVAWAQCWPLACWHGGWRAGRPRSRWRCGLIPRWKGLICSCKAPLPRCHSKRRWGSAFVCRLIWQTLAGSRLQFLH